MTERAGQSPGRRLRILFVPPRYAPYVGGVEAYCRGYAREMARRGHDVQIVCADEGPPLARVDGIPVRRCGTASKVANTNITPGLPLHIALAHADVVHTFLPTPWSADWAAVIGKLRGKRVVVSYTNDLVGAGVAGRVATLYNRFVLPMTLRAADGILVLTERGATAAPLRHVSHKVQVLPPGIDTERFCPDGGPRWPATFFFLGLLDEYHRYKGLDVLLRAVALARREWPAIRLVIGGRGKLLAEYRQLATDLGVADATEFRGYIADDDLLTLYRRCTAFVLPSLSADQEGFGLVAAEALACGAPLVVSGIVGIAPLITGQSLGEVVPAAAVGPLAAALMHRCRAGPDCAAAAASQRVAKRLSLSVIGARLEEIYRQE